MPTAPAAGEKITFNCEYYDKRTVTLAKSNLNYGVFFNNICATFEVENLTILYNERYIDSDNELSNLLNDGKTEYYLALYDAYEQ